MITTIFYLCANCLQFDGGEVSTRVLNETANVIEHQTEQEHTIASDSKKKCKGSRPKQSFKILAAS